MTGRDRIVLMCIVVLVVIAGGWMLVVSPKRDEAKKVEGQVSAAQSELSAAESTLADARSAQVDGGDAAQAGHPLDLVEDHLREVAPQKQVSRKERQAAAIAPGRQEWQKNLESAILKGARHLAF